MIDRYSNPEMKNLWSLKTKYNHMLEVELKVLETYAEFGIIKQEEYAYIKNNAIIDENYITELELETKHDVIAFVKSITEKLGEKARYFHFGLTSTDVVDTAQAITLKEANRLILSEFYGFNEVLKALALKYKNTPCIGRTHGIHAEVMSFGSKWLRYYAEMQRNLKRFEDACTCIEVGKISGAVGNFANISPDIESEVCKKLGIKAEPIATQVVARDRHIEYINALAMIATTMEKIALEVRELSRTEIGEVEEYFEKLQKGSSAMPHKRNPIASENICGCARIMRSYVDVAYENSLLWHERDISHSSAERIMLADATTLIYYMLHRYTNVLDKLVIYETRMYENIYMTKGLVFSGRVMATLINKGMARDEAYDLVQVCANKSYYDKISLLELLKETKALDYLKNEELSELFTIDYYLRNIDEIYKRVLEAK